jgi:hypothetical protein
LIRPELEGLRIWVAFSQSEGSTEDEIAQLNQLSRKKGDMANSSFPLFILYSGPGQME